MFLFFFSSRRRHTRYIGDWSSDVCSSDLVRKADVLSHERCRRRGWRLFWSAFFTASLVAGSLLGLGHAPRTDRKSTRLNSSHRCISYAVFCLKKKKKKQKNTNY